LTCRLVLRSAYCIQDRFPMSRAGPIRLRPLESDRVVARASARMTNPRVQRGLRAVTLLADQKAILVATAAVWLASHFSRRQHREEANRMVCSVLIAGALPHLFKLLVRRRRPDRSITARRNGIRRSGNAWDSFPSGHAVHLGAIAPSAARLAPRSIRPLVWPALLSLAATRVLILAHYPTDVLAGFGIGVALNRAVTRILDALTPRGEAITRRSGTATRREEAMAKFRAAFEKT
jgi:membrane-associated phospholipid phosphatase